jgi:hypothetical protein
LHLAIDGFDPPESMGSAYIHAALVGIHCLEVVASSIFGISKSTPDLCFKLRGSALLRQLHCLLAKIKARFCFAASEYNSGPISVDLR